MFDFPVSTRTQSIFIAVAMFTYIWSFVGTTNALGAMAQEDRWDPRHIELLPEEIRRAVAVRERACENELAAEHAFSLFLDGDLRDTTS